MRLPACADLIFYPLFEWGSHGYLSLSLLPIFVLILRPQGEKSGKGEKVIMREGEETQRDGYEGR